MAIFKCKMCGGTLEINNNETVAVCEYCGTKQTLPKLDDERKANLYDRANHFRRNNEFDKAMGIYEQILNDDNTDAESYWSIVLCRYGIEYVEDPKTKKRITTVNRAQYTSIFADEDYKSAIKYADENQKEIYESEAKAIDEIQKGILEISQKEEPFDVFICYKETDANGRRTPDSVLATELYHELTRDGFKVFFSRITLEDKLGEEYEPYIFAALNSAKVMVVLGTKPEYFNAVWVKNEWSRYLALIKNGAKKMLVPAYKDMDPYDLTEEFSHLQAQDMSKLGFMQDLVRGISKIISSAEPKTEAKETVVVNNVNTNIAPLLKRAFMFLEDGDFARADEFCEQVLNLEPECAEAYLGKLMVDFKVRKQDDLGRQQKRIDENSNFQKAYRFGNEKVKAKLTEYTKSIEAIRKDAILEEAKSKMTGDKISNYESAIDLLKPISDWKDADECILICENRVNEIAIHEEQKRNVEEREKEQERKERIKRKKKCKTVLISVSSLIAVITAITVFLVTTIIPQQKFCDIVSISANSTTTYGLKSDGAIVSTKLLGSYPVKNWTDIVAISAGDFHTVGLKIDGTVVAVGNNVYGQCNVSEWTDIVAISTGEYHTVGLKSDGTVVAVGNNDYGKCDVSDWKDIVAVSAGVNYTVGLKLDGTVVAVGFNGVGQCDVSQWTNIVAIEASGTHTVGLKSNGTVVATGCNDEGECNVNDWTDVIAISTGYYHTVGLKSDGTVVATGSNHNGECDIREWTDVVAITAGDWHTVGLKSDGTVIATGLNREGQCRVG